ncbi:MAG: hypothetical protein ACTSWN_05040, partial [Promethearchaeota archaeon]
MNKKIVYLSKIMDKALKKKMVQTFIEDLIEKLVIKSLRKLLGNAPKHLIFKILPQLENEQSMSLIEWFGFTFACVVSFFVTFLIIPKQILFMKKIGWVGNDIHKSERPAVAESGGISLIIGIVSGIIVLLFFFPEYSIPYLLSVASIALASAIGLIDDKLKLSAFKKIASVVFASVPMAILYCFFKFPDGTPYVPILGRLQVTILYIPFIFGFLTVLMNVNNMLEGYNGEGAGCSIVIFIALILGAIITGSLIAFLFILPVLTATIAFFRYNKYPAKIFPGDIGTLQLGIAMGCAAIIGNLEFSLIVAIIPHVLNAFHVIRSVHGFKESGTIKIKDIELTNGDYIKASSRKDAPLTIPRLIVAKKPLKEPALVKNIIMIVVASSILSVYSSFLVLMTKCGSYNISLAIRGAFVATGLCLLIYLAYPATRGLIVVIITVYFGVISLLAFIDKFVIGLGTLNWLIAILLATVGFVIWYVL